jgi:Kip1 ubiquitination-promoting complex protein 1
MRRWSVNSAAYGEQWAPGDVIGCCIDLSARRISFYRNGTCMGVAFSNVRCAASPPTPPSTPLASPPPLGLPQNAGLCFGAGPWRRGVAGPWRAAVPLQFSG